MLGSRLVRMSLVRIVLRPTITVLVGTMARPVDSRDMRGMLFHAIDSMA